jgi:predicted regulator of Ras-like GTPase activity (Roadblock/LC7/MglB family)
MFDAVLERARACAGVRAVVLIGMDGVPVAASADPSGGADELVAVTYADLARRAARASAEASHGGVEEMALSCDDARVVFRAVTHEYALLAVLEPHANLGRARYELLRAALDLRPELDG